jgi:hypothetical protein
MALGLTLKCNKIADIIYEEMERSAAQDFADRDRQERNMFQKISATLPPLVDILVYSQANVEDSTPEDMIFVTEEKLRI